MRRYLTAAASFVLAASIFIGCTQQPEAVIPRSDLFGNPDKASLKISPDGRYISYLAPVNDVLNVWVAPVDKPDQAKAVTKDDSRGIRQYFWSYTGGRLLYLQDKGGDENWMLYSVNVETGDEMNLTPFEEILGDDGEPIMLPSGKKMRPRVQVQELSHDFPEEILIGLNNRDAQWFDIYKLNIVSGEMQLLLKNEGYNSYVTDEKFDIRFASKMTPDGGIEYFTPDGNGSWTSFMKVGSEDMMTTRIFGFDKSGQTLYMIDSRGRNTAALKSLDLVSNESIVLAEDDLADINNIMMHPTEYTIQAASSNYERTQWQILDPVIEDDMTYLKSVVDGEIKVTSRTRDDDFWTVAYVKDDGPVRYYLYDREAENAKFLFTNRKVLEQHNLSHMHPVVIDARDGLKLVSYLTLPSWTDSDNDGRPDVPLPMVLFVHGGPWARDSWGYNPYHQWLSNRGYAVLSVNFRGSTGFGKGFTNAANLEWAGKMHDDLMDAVQWSVDEGVADQAKIAIMGGSYGGYATLVGLTFTPDVFACGVDIVGPSNLRTLLETIPPYWKPMMDYWAARVGDPRTDEGRAFLDSKSPLTYVDKISKPLLIGQGANDPRVKQSEADQIAKAMQEKNIPVTYVLYPDEGHGFARPPNNLSFNAVTEAFLAQHLGGRVQPIGKDFEDSSIEIPAGMDQVPGLSEAMK